MDTPSPTTSLSLAVKALLATMLVCFGLMVSVSEPFLSTWLAMFFIALVPAQILTSIWEDNGVAQRFFPDSQPHKGLARIAFTLLVALIVTLLVFATVGGMSHYPKPPMMHYLIVTVVFSFWFVIVWNGWPLNFGQGRLARGHYSALAFLGICFGVAYLLFAGLFNFAFLQGSALYVAELDPQGAFNAWYSVSFLVTTVAVLFSLVLLEFRPVTSLATPAQGLRWGLLNSALILAVSAAIFGLATQVFELDPVLYLVHGPVSFIFGVFVPLNLCEGRLFGRLSGYRRGMMLILVAAISGLILNRLYFAIASYMTDNLSSGAPGYDLELWVANAMLAFSFPVLVMITEHLQFWPLRRPASPVSAPPQTAPKSLA
ncbi:MAG: hypothetical protein R3183_07225 [Oleiphilaceae bacterium]|nr:hypothetical protein [Oleiphilaceae bacterium]